MDLTNETAGINCDKNGLILPGAVRPSCTAVLKYNGEDVEDVYYDITYPISQNVSGLSIDHTTGELIFNSGSASTPFSFAGTPLEITVTAAVDEDIKGTKIMTITKQYPGEDGLSVTRWITTSASEILYDVNVPSVSPSSISAVVYKQEGENQPEIDTGTTIYWGYDTSYPSNIYTSPITNINVSRSYLCFGLKNDRLQFYEIETVPINKTGRNGQDGQPGHDGTDGTDGTSPYRLDLTNQSAGINCDKDGNVLPGAKRPTCTAQLYAGTSAVTASYSISGSETLVGVSINSSTGVLTFTSAFTFTQTTLEITVYAKIGGVTIATAIMTVMKNIAGLDGQPAVTYWIAPTANAVHVTSGGTVSPSSIGVVKYKQVGEETPVVTSEGTVYYDFDTVEPSHVYSSPITITASHDYLTLLYKVDNIQRDIETIPINKDGQPGQPGATGRTGASVRGPVDWYKQTVGRWYYNGQATSEHPEYGLYLDVIQKDNVKYYCNTSYYGTPTDSWATVSSYWTSASTEFDFVATNLLLANYAKINFTTTTGLYLRDSNDNITGGAQAATNADSVVFWAGAANPSSGNFQVDYQGNITAKSGTFSGFVQMPYRRTSEVSTSPGSNAYLVCDKYGDSYKDGSILDLSSPSESLNGFTYEIVAMPNTDPRNQQRSATYKPSKRGFYHSVTVRANNLMVMTYTDTNIVSTFNVLGFGAGHIKITCMPNPYGSGYVWGVTQCCDVDCYSGTTLQQSYANVYSDNTITKVIKVSTIPSSKQEGVGYFSEN